MRPLVRPMRLVRPISETSEANETVSETMIIIIITIYPSNNNHFLRVVVVVVTPIMYYNIYYSP